MHREIEFNWSEIVRLGMLLNLGETEFGRLRGKINKEAVGSIEWDSKVVRFRLLGEGKATDHKQTEEKVRESRRQREKTKQIAQAFI